MIHYLSHSLSHTHTHTHTHFLSLPRSDFPVTGMQSQYDMNLPLHQTENLMLSVPMFSKNN